MVLSGTMRHVLFWTAVTAMVIFALECRAEDAVDGEDVEVDQEKVDYAKGSICGYCRYCQVRRRDDSIAITSIVR